MIIELTQKYNGLEVSYSTVDGTVETAFFKISDEPNRFTVWKRTDDGKPDVNFPTKTDIAGKPVKLTYEKRFDRFSMIEFLSRLPDETKKLLFNPKNHLNYYAFDIETEIGDGFPEPELAEQRICSIATTAPDDDNTTVVQTIYPLNEEECVQVENMVNDWLFVKHKAVEAPIKVSVLQHANEHEMMRHFVSSIWRNAPILSGWNSDGFDFPYIRNRCKKLNIDLSAASIVDTLDYKGMPLHKLHLDAMRMTKEYDRSLGYVNSYALTYIGEKCLGLPKLQYDGNLKQLYENDKVKFTAYNVIDTVIVQLLNKSRGLINALYGLANSAKMPLRLADGPVAQSEFVLFNEMLDNEAYKDTVFAIDTDFGELHPYEGGYVKHPVRPYAKYLACFDYSSLYPSLMKTCDISPEKFIRKLTAEDKKPENLKKLIDNPDYFVGVNGSLYDNTKVGLYKIVQSKLYDNRQAYKKATAGKMGNRNPIRAEIERREAANKNK